MKKVILSAIAIIAFGFVNAQEVKFGIKTGMNLSNWTGDTKVRSLKYIFGINAGGFAEIKVSDRFGIQPEILYSTQGTKNKNFGAYVDGRFRKGDIKMDLSYINIPVMFKYSTDGKSFMEAGPQIGFLTSAKARTKIDGFSETVEEDVKKIFKSLDFGINIGAGYNFNKHLLTSLRYNIGLANIAKTEPGEDMKIHNSVFSLSMGYKF